MKKLAGIEGSIREIKRTYAAALRSSSRQIAQLKEEYGGVIQVSSEQMKESTKQVKVAAEFNENTDKMLCENNL